MEQGFGWDVSCLGPKSVFSSVKEYSTEGRKQVPPPTSPMEVSPVLASVELGSYGVMGSSKSAVTEVSPSKGDGARQKAKESQTLESPELCPSEPPFAESSWGF